MIDGVYVLVFGTKWFCSQTIPFVINPVINGIYTFAQFYKIKIK